MKKVLCSSCPSAARPCRPPAAGAGACQLFALDGSRAAGVHLRQQLPRLVYCADLTGDSEERRFRRARNCRDVQDRRLAGNPALECAGGKNETKRTLALGQVDVLTLACMLEPDEGIEKFATFAYQHNANVRVVLQEFWIPWDKFEWPFQGNESTVNPDAATPAFLDRLHRPYFKPMDDYVWSLDSRLGRPWVLIATMGQPCVMLPKKVIAHEIAAISTQSARFTDKLGHPQPPIHA